jgi:hypothetical protein
MSPEQAYNHLALVQGERAQAEAAAEMEVGPDLGGAGGFYDHGARPGAER